MIDFFALIEKLDDNLGLIYAYVTGDKNDPLAEKFCSNGGVFPPKLSSQFLTGDYSSSLNKNYGKEDAAILKQFDLGELDEIAY